MYLSFRQWFLVTLFSILIFAISLIHTLHTNFFATMVEKRNITSVGITSIFVIFDLGAILFSAILGTCIEVWSLKRVLCISTFVQAFSVILFGILDDVKGHWILLGCACVLRIFEGVAFVGTAVAVYSCIPTEFQTVNIPIIYGIINMCFVLGNCGGPFIGELLYQIGGFLCPFLFVGVILITIGLFMPLIFWKLPVPPEVEQINKYFLLFRKPMTLINLLVLALQMMLLMLIYTIFPNYLQYTFHLEPTAVDFTFGIVVLFQALTSPVWGFVAKNYVLQQVTILFGGLLTLVSTILIGPLPLFGIKPNLILTIIGVTLLSIGISAIFLASFLCLTREAWRYGYLKNRSTMGMVSSAYMGTLFLGGGIGAVISGLVYEIIGYKLLPYLFFGISILILTLNISYTGGSVFKYIFGKTENIDSKIENDSGRESLDEEEAPLIKVKQMSVTIADENVPTKFTKM